MRALWFAAGVTQRTTTGPHQGAFLGSVGPAFAHGCHDLGELRVEGVKLLSFRDARDEGASVASRARAPYSLNRPRSGDVCQGVRRTRSARCPGRHALGRRGRTLVPIQPWPRPGPASGGCRTVQAVRPFGAGLRRTPSRVRSVRGRQQSDPRIGQSSLVVLGPRVGGHLLAMPSRGSRGQPARVNRRHLYDDLRPDWSRGRMTGRRPWARPVGLGRRPPLPRWRPVGRRRASRRPRRGACLPVVQAKDVQVALVCSKTSRRVPEPLRFSSCVAASGDLGARLEG